MSIRWLGVFFLLCLLMSPMAQAAETSYTDPAAGIAFAAIKGGCFQMGDSVGDGDPNERPVHEVCLNDFSMAKYTVTNAQFRMFRSGHSSGKYENISLNDDKMPAVGVTWDDAVAYAKWLSEKTGQKFRLPTEAEWEYAARGGTKTSRFWGNAPDEACAYANVADMTAKQRWPKWTSFYCDDKFAVASPVGSFKPNQYGLFDMLGNVWQWTQDVYSSEAYVKLPKMNPVYEGSGEYRVMRGGGWSNGPLGIRSSHRVGLSPTFGHHALGFRLVKE